MTVRVAGLDLSLSKSGMALPDGTFATIAPPARMDGYARHLHVLETLLHRLYVDGYPDVVAIEGYSYHAPGPIALIRAAEIGGLVRAELTRAVVPFVDIGPAVLKKYATGKGNASKVAVFDAAIFALARARGRGVLLEDPERVPAGYDEAEAYWLRRIAIEHYEGVDRAVLEQITWPELEVTQ